MSDMKKNIYFAIMLGASMVSMSGLTSCQADMDDPGTIVPEATIKPNITLLELKNAYENKYSQPVYMPGTWILDDDGNIIGGDPVVVHGRVVSSDASGNIYKSLVIQDETAALAFSINQGSLYNEYRLGQEMVVDMTGLYMGYYSGLQQVGYPDGDYNGTPQVGFMAYDYWLKNAQRNGLPDPSFEIVPMGGDYPTDIYYMIAFNSFDELTNGTLPELQSQLVEFRNVHFQFDSDDEELPYSIYQENANRTLVDANGATLTVRNSGYSNFYNQLIPHGVGKVRGILSYYGDSWQLTLRDLRDVIIGKQGYEDDPFTVEEVLTEQYAGLTGWTKGYIVGSVKAGVTQVTGNNDVIFGTAAEMDNNVLIAATADETNVTNCAIVELPQNTMLRYYVNLIDNPDVYKKELMINGQLGYFLGMPGVSASKGDRLSFKLNGENVADPGAAPAPAGSGTEADPYNISYVMQTTADQTDVWVEGYVAGYVRTGDYMEANNEFSATGSGNNYENSSNVIISAVPLPFCATANSVPAQLSATCRPVLGLKLNPGIYGRKVKVKCTVRDYLGTRGIRQITEVVVL